MFRASSDSQDVCPVCLNDEFSAGATLSDGSDDVVAKMQFSAMQRQNARATRLGKRLRVRNPFSLNGRVRCALAVFLFAICVFLFLLSDGEEPTFLNQLEYHYQLCISLGTAIVSVALILPSFSGHKTQVSAAVIVILLMGCAMPTMWHYRVDDSEVYTDMPSETQTPEAPVQNNGRFLDDKELVMFNNAKKNHPNRVHYAVFLRYGVQQEEYPEGKLKYTPYGNDVILLVRSSLSRLLHGANVESLKSETGYGVVFTITNAPGEKQNIAAILSRYGDVYFSDPENGVYEVAFDEKKIMLGRNGQVDQKRDPDHLQYVELNLESLRSLDAETVRAAAVHLANSNVKRLKNDIFHCLLDVLQDPWETAPDTYKALVDALVVFEPENSFDPRVFDILMNYFKFESKRNRDVSLRVVTRMAKERPEEMHDPILKLWIHSPDAWNGVAGVLAEQLEPYMIEQLQLPNIEIAKMLNVLRYLEPYGTVKSIPALRHVSETATEQTIRQKASDVITTIELRAAKEQN